MSDAEQQQQGAEAQGETLEASEFASLLNKQIKPKSDRAREEIETAVTTLAAQAMQNASVISDDAIKSIESMIAEIDKL
jgi:type VI secretion system protein ImpC